MESSGIKYQFAFKSGFIIQKHLINIFRWNIALKKELSFLEIFLAFSFFNTITFLFYMNFSIIKMCNFIHIPEILFLPLNHMIPVFVEGIWAPY